MAPCRKLIDRRRQQPRRYERIRRELLSDLADGHDVEKLGVADVAMAESAALLILRLHTLRAEMLSGSAARDGELVRVANAAARLLGALRGKRRTKRVTTLDEYLAGDDHDQKDEA